ncbi:GTP-binding protein [Paenibacillus oenotherae]|uniref:GTP-binding protein n=2 Tax=Paenibacillus oenotherae TaxID=1435645 RepID=A0ABS7D936_9BACL|nr:GTP-binding protein [Paenibacillus oenotherae]
MDNKRTIPIYLFSGFLGSGKTTLLNHVIDYYKAADVKVAVIMNELGDVNLDGQLVDSDIPMAEMLSGCICCTIRGDLSMEIKDLIEEHRPDVIIIESTGAANPLEIIDGITETSMYTRIDLRKVITVVDGPELLARSRRGGRTYKLMQDQIRCATDLIVNKADKIAPEELVEAQQLIRELNPHAPLTVTIRCVTDMRLFDLSEQAASIGSWPHHEHDQHICGANCTHDSHDDASNHDHNHASHDNVSNRDHNQDSHDNASNRDHQHDSQDHTHANGQHNSESHHHHHHHTHEHVMTLTHYFDRAVSSHAFEALIAALPKEVYRAKGILTFSDTNSRFLFQYAYRELEFTRITPQGHVNDVAVFIGEHFAKEELLRMLRQLEQ